MRCLARYLVLSGSVLRISGVPDRIGRISQGLSAGHLKNETLITHSSVRIT